jgi:hypothetical protein
VTTRRSPVPARSKRPGTGCTGALTEVARPARPGGPSSCGARARDSIPTLVPVRLFTAAIPVVAAFPDRGVEMQRSTGGAVHDVRGLSGPHTDQHRWGHRNPGPASATGAHASGSGRAGTGKGARDGVRPGRAERTRPRPRLGGARRRGGGRVRAGSHARWRGRGRRRPGAVGDVPSWRRRFRSIPASAGHAAVTRYLPGTGEPIDGQPTLSKWPTTGREPTADEPPTTGRDPTAGERPPTDQLRRAGIAHPAAGGASRRRRHRVRECAAGQPDRLAGRRGADVPAVATGLRHTDPAGGGRRPVTDPCAPATAAGPAGLQ